MNIKTTLLTKINNVKKFSFLHPSFKYVGIATVNKETTIDIVNISITGKVLLLVVVGGGLWYFGSALCKCYFPFKPIVEKTKVTESVVQVTEPAAQVVEPVAVARVTKSIVQLAKLECPTKYDMLHPKVRTIMLTDSPRAYIPNRFRVGYLFEYQFDLNSHALNIQQDIISLI